MYKESSQELHQIVFDEAKDGLSIIKDLHHLHVNKAFCEMFGYERQELLGKHINLTIHPDDREMVISYALERIEKGRAPEKYEFRGIRKDETEIVVDASISSFKWKDETLVLADFRDITEKKRLEMEKIREMERFIALVENASFGMILHNVKGEILRINKRFESITGYNTQEIKTIEEFLKSVFPDPTYKSQIQRMWEEAPLNGGTYRGISKMFKIVRKDGKQREVHFISCRLSHDEFLTILEDVTIAVKNQSMIQASRERYKNLFEQAPCGIFQSKHDGRLIRANETALRMFGFSSLQEAVRNVRDIRELYVDPQKRQEFLKILNEKGVVNGFETEMVKKDGKKILVSINAKKYQGENFSYIEGTLEDVTERKQIEERLLAAQKMEAIGRLSGGIAHDFNNILMAIQGHVSLMLLDVEKNHPFYKRLKGIEDLVKSASDLTRELLSFARGQRFDVTVQDIKGILERVLKIFERARKDIEIQRDFPRGSIFSEVERSQIEQVFYNIVENACEAMKDGGTLHVKIESVNIDEKSALSHDIPPRRYAKISISDTGHGMDEETRRRIFEPFFTTKERRRGTGFGLSIAYGIVKAHRGGIEVKPEKNKGSTFTVYLPEAKKEEEILTKEQEPIKKRNGTILLVDDEDNILNVTKELLEVLGYRVITAKDGFSAEEIYKEKGSTIDLVILDMVMPGMSGKETFRRLKAIRRDAKVLIATGYVIEEDAEKVLEEGAIGIVYKPYTIDLLSKKLEDMFK